MEEGGGGGGGGGGRHEAWRRGRGPAARERRGRGGAAVLDDGGARRRKIWQPDGVILEICLRLPRVEAGAATYIAPPLSSRFVAPTGTKGGLLSRLEVRPGTKGGGGRCPLRAQFWAFRPGSGNEPGQKAPKSARERFFWTGLLSRLVVRTGSKGGPFLPVLATNQDESVVLPRGQSLVPPR